MTEINASSENQKSRPENRAPQCRGWTRRLGMCLLGSVLIWLITGQVLGFVARRAESQGQLSRVSQMLGWCQRLCPWDASLYSLGARCARRQGDLAAWASLVEKWSAHSPGSVALKAERELMRIQSGAFAADPQAQVARLIHAGVDPDQIAEASFLGQVVLRDLEQANTALAWWEGLNLRPLDMRLSRVILLRMQGKEEEARAACEAILSVCPQHELARVHLADLLVEIHRLTDALEHYVWLVQRLPHFTVARVGAARCLRYLGRYDAAEKVLSSALNQPTPAAEVLQESGQIALEQGDYLLAQQYLAPGTPPRNPQHDERMAIATVFALQGNPAAGREILQRDARIESDGKRQLDLQTALAIDPGNAGLHLQLQATTEELQRMGH